LEGKLSSLGEGEGTAAIRFIAHGADVEKERGDADCAAAEELGNGSADWAVVGGSHSG
jgi:ABC-type nitrate/sulfonate/bicarbonate transport system substrate-binding protein